MEAEEPSCEADCKGATPKQIGEAVLRHWADLPLDSTCASRRTLAQLKLDTRGLVFRELKGERFVVYRTGHWPIRAGDDQLCQRKGAGGPPVGVRREDDSGTNRNPLRSWSTR